MARKKPTKVEEVEPDLVESDEEEVVEEVVEEREEPCAEVVLTKSVQVADVDAYPEGGPLVTIPRATPINEIDPRYLEQLCEKHFTRIPFDQLPTTSA